MEYNVFITLFILAIPLALFVIFKPIIKDKTVRNNVMNSDPSMRHYCFVLNCNQQEAIGQLSIRNVKDTPECTLDINALIITFSHIGVSIDYQLSFYTIENRTYLKVSRIKRFHNRSNIPFMINSFFINKIGAIPVDYTYFESVVCSAK